MSTVKLRPLLREALASAAASRVSSTLTTVLVLAMCVMVLLTTGKTVGLEQAILASIDQTGTRTIIVRAEPEAGIDGTVISRLAAVPALQWAGVFGPASDVRNSAVPEGQAVASRTVWTTGESSPLGVARLGEIPIAIASDRALTKLGMPDTVGTVRTAAGNGVSVVARFEIPDYLSFMDPIVLIPRTATESEPVAIVVVVVEHVSNIPIINALIPNILGAADPTKVTIETTAEFAKVQEVVAGQLGGYGSALVAATLIALAGVVASLLWGLVMIRRKDFGRRRALGASQPLIISLVLLQTGICAVIGAVLGTLSGIVALELLGDPQPSPRFSLAVAVLAITASLLGALPPAVLASRREPLTELRVP